MREQLPTVAIQERSGPYANMWRLKPEYRQFLDEEDEESRLDRLVSQQVPSLGAALARAKAKGHLQTVDPYGQS